MEFSYYPGCTLTGSAKELDESFRSVAEKLRRNASVRSPIGHAAELLLRIWWTITSKRPCLLRTLTAERLGKDVVAPCAGCHVRMKAASKRILEEKELRDRFPFKGQDQGNVRNGHV